MLKNLVEYVVKSLVCFPEQVVVNALEGEKTTIIELKVAQEDMGRVIGKEGHIIKALRILAGASASKLSKVVIEILK